MGKLSKGMDKLNAAQRHKLKQFVKQLEGYKGRGTELVSVYVPAGYDLNAIIGQLQDEQGTATNIKSKQTKTNVIDALERMIQHLKNVKKTPPNGMAIFSGNVAEREGQSDVRVWGMEIPVPNNQRLYRCDKEFILEPLRDIVDNENVYGLVVLDRRDAMLGLLKGKKIVPVVQTHSEVPGKHKSGGQCLLPDTLVQTATGNILPMDALHNPLSVKAMEQGRIVDSPITDKWTAEKNKIYTIITESPRLEISSSGDHTFFVRDDELKELPARELRKGDYLIMPERIAVRGKVQLLSKKDFTQYITTPEASKWLRTLRQKQGLSQKQLSRMAELGQSTISAFERGELNLSENVLNRLCKALSVSFEDLRQQLSVGRTIKLPGILKPDLAKCVGYYLGDGSREHDRLTFFEQREDVAAHYERLLTSIFSVNVNTKYRRDKHYYQIRLYGQQVVKFMDDNFPEISGALTSTIPKKVFMSPPSVVAGFLQGLFDAEGYVVKDKVGIGMNNKKIIQSMQMLLLRFGIVSSFLQYDNRRNPYSNNTRYILQITDKISLRAFRRRIGWSSSEKKKKLDQLISQKSEMTRIRQMFPTGRMVRQIIEDAGHNLELFPKVNSFFRNERGLSKTAFIRSVAEEVDDKQLREKLLGLVNTPLLPVKIASIKTTKKKTKMVDISVRNQSFVANCVIVHNSAQRFERLREGATIEHFKKIAAYMKDQFLPMGEELKGIILGGPGVTINKFMGHDYITGDLKKKILGTKDLSYTGEFGLQELLEKASDILADEEVADEKKIMQKFFGELSKDTGLAAYGQKDVMDMIQYGAVQMVLLSEALGDEMMELYEAEAEKMGTEVKVISTHTREGVQLREMGKIAAILRYRVEN
ncbi:helix-turn-helix domain-containing protein [Candidatus Woesearchaeota archaeon]|nr:helix-turn-helix domain-containing protein [Candidatus Woesearchaeota archaeon]